MAYNSRAREKEIENRLRKDYFQGYDAETILGDVDFAVAIPSDDLQMFEQEYLLWAEAKKSTNNDIRESLVQLILTIGKARTFDRHLPPAFLGAFDSEKIAFVKYYNFHDIFSLSYINWSVRPSDHDSETFHLLYNLVKETLDKEMLLFHYDTDDHELRTFIKRNFISGKSKISKVRINKTNFTAIYQKWLHEVKPSINANWALAKNSGILDADFYLADIMSKDNIYLPLKDKLRVLLCRNHYEFDREIDEMGFFKSRTAEFNDKQKAHIRFWNRYDRPPRREYWDYIVMRRDLLVPQDIREIKGSFFTPAKWVNLSQQFLFDHFNDNWQEDYYIWDCAAGTGNLLANLTNKYRIWASTLDPADVAVMHDRIKTMNEASSNGKSGANLLDSHVFQFDFLNDSFDKLPPKLKGIIDDENERKKLIIYINPPYKEASNKRTITGTGQNQAGLSETYVKRKYQKVLGKAMNELYGHFLIRIYKEIPGAYIANFSSLKLVQSSNFREFRSAFKAKMDHSFIVPAKTFDNVDSDFPIGFYIWNTQENEEIFQKTIADVYDKDGILLGKKNIYSFQEDKLIIDWLRSYYDKEHKAIGFQMVIGTDIQHNNGVYISNWVRVNDIKKHMYTRITYKNIFPMVIYTAVRQIIKNTWINNKDIYLWPNDDWKDDKFFQSDCLTYCLFNNTIECEKNDNHWIPFSEQEVGAKDSFKSNFMVNFLNGVIKEEYTKTEKKEIKDESDIFEIENEVENIHIEKIVFSQVALAVLDAGRELWKYYHKQSKAKPDASLYDIRLHFQGKKLTANGKEQMSPDSKDSHYMNLIGDLRQKIKALTEEIEPKIYEYGFLKRNYDKLSREPKFMEPIPVSPPVVKHKEYIPPFDEEAEVEMRPQEQQTILQVNIVNNNTFEKNVGAVIISGDTGDIKDIIEIKKEE